MFARAALRPKSCRQHLYEFFPGQGRIVQMHAVGPRMTASLIAARMTVVLPVPDSPTRSVRLSAGNRVLEIAERLPVHLGCDQVSRVRRQIKRTFTKSVEMSVHRPQHTSEEPFADNDRVVRLHHVLKLALMVRSCPSICRMI